MITKIMRSPKAHWILGDRAVCKVQRNCSPKNDVFYYRWHIFQP